MATKVDISISGIGEQIELAERRLSAAAREVPSQVEKKRLLAKVRALKKVKVRVKALCRSYNITVPGK